MADSGFNAVDDKALAHAHADLLKHADIQFAFPTFKLPVEPDWLKWLGPWLRAHGAGIKWGLWIVGAIILSYFVYTLVRQYWRPFRLWRKGGSAAKPPRAEVWRPAPAQARQLLHEADALAAQGEYSQAVHLLLLRSIEDIEERRPYIVRRALTSREIGTLRDLPERARPAFRGIAKAVELSLFAGQPVGAAEFARCRADYEAFAFPVVWQVAA